MMTMPPRRRQPLGHPPPTAPRPHPAAALGAAPQAVRRAERVRVPLHRRGPRGGRLGGGGMTPSTTLTLLVTLAVTFAILWKTGDPQ